MAKKAKKRNDITARGSGKTLLKLFGIVAMKKTVISKTISS